MERGADMHKIKILVIGDCHIPFHNKPTVRNIMKAIKEEKPTHVVQIGDLLDQYNFSRFTKKNIMTAVKEIKLARKYSKQMWEDVRKNAPGVKCYQILGNHCVRLTKRIAEKVPEAYELVKEKLDELYTFKGVRTIYDGRTELKICGITFMHGYRSKLGDHMRYNRSSTVCGHSHVGGVVYEQSNGRTIWELNAGYCADEKSEPLKYRPQSTSKWTLGYGLITWKGGIPAPQFVPIRSR